ncbi:hypothetical protein [Paludisphaera soli]|uniref:hypothetical protein n=1 Tax=Paludisphaera soli TaxID=2712865 RepID=UPI001980FD02|nr:hypothetical protein [Paludisphaera soli]
MVGFLAIEPLRRARLLAFRTIARASGGGFIALHADSDEVDDLFWSGRPPWECVERMEELWRPPDGSVEGLETRIIAAAEIDLPSSVWFFEDVKGEA